MSEVWVTNVSSGATSDGVEEEYVIMHLVHTWFIDISPGALLP